MSFTLWNSHILCTFPTCLYMKLNNNYFHEYFIISQWIKLRIDLAFLYILYFVLPMHAYIWRYICRVIRRIKIHDKRYFLISMSIQSYINSHIHYMEWYIYLTQLVSTFDIDHQCHDLGSNSRRTNPHHQHFLEQLFCLPTPNWWIDGNIRDFQISNIYIYLYCTVYLRACT